jgi:hypothetical protein
MGTTTTTFALNKPTVGGDDNAWGSALNDNADKLDDLLDGTTAIKPNLSEGLWKVGGVAVTSTAAELNVLDGIPGTLTATELGYVDGVTSAIQTQLDNKQALDADLTAIAGLSSNGLVARTGAGTAAARTVTAGTGITVTDGDGVAGNPTVAATLASQAEAEAGTDNTKLMTPLRLRNALNATGSAPVYACRAWVNFNGTGTVAIRASGNVTSITDNGTGTYTVNFTTAMPDANYAVSAFARRSTTSAPVYVGQGSTQTQTASAVQITVAATAANIEDSDNISVAVFR